MVLPSKRGDSLGRRRSHPSIKFYDLGWITDGSGGWRDLPILKTPTFTTSSVLVGHVRELNFTMESFTQTDFQAYTDLLMEVPVTEWSQNYRRIPYVLDPSSSPVGDAVAGVTVSEFPVTLGFYDHDGITRNYTSLAADTSTPEGGTRRSSNLSTYGACWDARGRDYTTLDRLEIGAPFGGGYPALEVFEWFRIQTDDPTDFKITSVYDHTAPDVADTLTISGQIEVYLVPLVGCFATMGTLDPSNITNMPQQILGPWYQAYPRDHFWPLVSEDDFLDYQKGRTGAQASQWNSDFSWNTIDPADFSPARTFSPFTQVAFGGGTVLNTGLDDLFTQYFGDGGSIFTGGVPFLMGVLKMHGHFYYVWSVGDSGFNLVENDCNRVKVLI